MLLKNCYSLFENIFFKYYAKASKQESFFSLVSLAPSGSPLNPGAYFKFGLFFFPFLLACRSQLASFMHEIALIHCRIILRIKCKKTIRNNSFVRSFVGSFIHSLHIQPSIYTTHSHTHPIFFYSLSLFSHFVIQFEEAEDKRRKRNEQLQRRTEIKIVVPFRSKLFLSCFVL